MRNIHPLQNIVEYQNKGIHAGICSICSANELVIEAAMERFLKEEEYVFIEATANQVNQYGGYTGMNPYEFASFIYSIAQKVEFPKERIILGGDHLGPVVWKNEKSNISMSKAEELVRMSVLAGFTKIHIDTSMRLADDNMDSELDLNIIAERGAFLARTAEEAYMDLKDSISNILPPVYIIGSEVPVPGGKETLRKEQNLSDRDISENIQSEKIHITSVTNLEQTISAYKDAFFKYVSEDAWNRVVAVVIQPGVEFGDNSIFEYKRNKETKELCKALRRYNNIVFEGHSTDYQTRDALKNMVEDGIAILKVGPALTFALREALFALNYIENELLGDMPDVTLSSFIETLEQEMLRYPKYWENYYCGQENKKKIGRKYSYYDRGRYYLPICDVKDSINRLFSNLRLVDIPLPVISQFMPVQYLKIRNSMLSIDPEHLAKDRIINCIDDYLYAIREV